MLQALFEYLHNNFDIPGTGLFQYLSFRAVAAFILAIIILIFAGQPIIKLLRRQKVGETIRSLGLEGEKSKAGTPTMGGILILGAILIPTLLVGKLDNIYIQLMLVTTIWCGTIGFIDDYIKVFRHNKDGLNGRMKIVGQIGLGIIVGSVMFFSADVVVRRHSTITPQEQVAGVNNVVPFTAPDFPAETPEEQEGHEVAELVKKVVEAQPAPPPEKAEEKTYTSPEVRKALVDARGKGINVKEILAGFGAENFQALPASKYGALMEALEVIG